MNNQYPWLQGSGYLDSAMSTYNQAAVPNNLSFLGNNYSYLQQIPQSNLSTNINPFQMADTGQSIGNAMGGLDWLSGAGGAQGGFGQGLGDFTSKYGSAIGSGIQGLASAWGAWNGMQQTKLAKEQMATSIDQWNKNYANQVQTYNTRLEDRTRARAAATGQSQAAQDSYLNQHRLK